MTVLQENELKNHSTHPYYMPGHIQLKPFQESMAITIQLYTGWP